LAVAETALVVLFRQLEPLIGELRRRYTPSGAEGLAAHVTLIVPFAETPGEFKVLPAVARTVERFAPFEVAFRRTARFPATAEDPETLYLAPEPAQRLVALTQALARAIPEFPPYGGKFDEVVPHSTVAQGDDRVLRDAERRLAPHLPVTARVERVWVVEHAPKGWRRRSAFPLLGREGA
jgi:2'-5' RNA ligase